MLLVVGDAWQESQHPRDNSGKFSETSGGGGSTTQSPGGGPTSTGAPQTSATSASYVASKQLKQVFKKHGLKEVTGESKPTFYLPAKNIKVVVHPPSSGAGIGSKFSIKSSSGEQLHKGFGFNQLDALLKNIAGGPLSGQGSIHPNASQQQQTKPVVGTQSNTPGAPKQEMEALGYKEDHGSNEEVVYTKPNGAAVKIKENGDWVAYTPGYATKAGSGLESLQTLLSGKTPNGPVPWHNAPNEIVLTSAHKAQQAEQAKQNEFKAHVAKTAQTLIASRTQATDNERSAVGHYTDGGYTSMNRDLRAGKKPTGQAATTTKYLDEFLAKNSAPEDLKLYRKVSGDYANILKSVMFPGAKFIDRGFVSTSINDGWSGSLHWKINVPKGSKGAYVDDISSHRGEREFILPRNSVFVVKSWDESSHILELDLEPGDNA